MTSTHTRPVDNVVIATKSLQDRNTNIIAGTTVENKGKLILTEIFPSVQNMIFFSINIMYWKYFILKISGLKDLRHANNKRNSNYYFSVSLISV